MINLTIGNDMSFCKAQQIYAMGTQKLTDMFGPNPCPQATAP